MTPKYFTIQFGAECDVEGGPVVVNLLLLLALIFIYKAKHTARSIENKLSFFRGEIDREQCDAPSVASS